MLGFVMMFLIIFFKTRSNKVCFLTWSNKSLNLSCYITEKVVYMYLIRAQLLNVGDFSTENFKDINGS